MTDITTIQDQVNTVVTELRNLVETKNNASADFKEKFEKLSNALSESDKKQNELVDEIKNQKQKEQEMSSKIQLLEKKFLRPHGKSDFIDNTPEVKAFEKAMRSSDVHFKQEINELVKNYAFKNEQKYMRTDVNEDGGFLCPPEWSSMILEKVTEIDPMRNLCTVQTISAKEFNMPIEDAHLTAEWEGEYEEAGETNPKFGNIKITAHRLSASVTVTYEMLNDGHYDLNGFIQSTTAKQFAFAEGQSFLNGNGVKQPTGLLNESGIATLKSGIANNFEVDNIIKMTGEIKSGYNPVFLLNRRTLADLATRKDGTGGYIWQSGVLQVGKPNTIMGVPYYYANSMDDIGAGKTPVLFGDLKYYYIADRFGMYLIRDDFTLAKRATVRFVFHKYVGGKCVMPEAFIKLTCEA